MKTTMRTMRDWLRGLWAAQPPLTPEQREELLLRSHPRCC